MTQNSYNITINSDTTIKEPYKYIIRIIALKLFIVYILLLFFIVGDMIVTYKNIKDHNDCIKTHYNFI